VIKTTNSTNETQQNQNIRPSINPSFQLQNKRKLTSLVVRNTTADTKHILHNALLAATENTALYL